MIRKVEKNGIISQALAFSCPGCSTLGLSSLHMVTVNSRAVSPSWEWDGRFDHPTISPSIRVLCGIGETSHVCHSYLRDGVIEFLDDCTHELAGQKVPLPDIPGWLSDGG